MASAWLWGRVFWVGNRSWGENQGLLAKQTAQGFDFVRKPVREDSQGGLHRLSAFAEEDSGGSCNGDTAMVIAR
jgi:hypothetical protein